MSRKSNRYIYIYLNPLKQGKFTYKNFITFFHEPFYVGLGSNRRYLDHISESIFTTHNPHKYHTIQQIKKSNYNIKDFIVKVDVNLSKKRAIELEKFYINIIGKRVDSTGSLTNLTDGGNSGPTIAWNKGISKYPAIDIDQIIFCACGCGNKIPLEKRQRYDGLPKYIRSHGTRKHKGKYKHDIDFNQIAYCKCGCGEQLQLKPHHRQNGIPSFKRGHNARTND